MIRSRKAVAVRAADVEARKGSNYPEPYAARVAGREKRRLGEVFGLRNFGVNLTTLEPGAMSALRHWHGCQDEFIYVLDGYPTLITAQGETELVPGDCAGFPAGEADGHHLLNRTDRPVRYLEIGDRAPGDSVTYPDDDIAAVLDGGGQWQFRHKDGTPF